MTADKVSLRQEILAARDELLAAVEHLSESDWQKPVPAEGWTVRDVLAHLAANRQPRTIRCLAPIPGDRITRAACAWKIFVVPS